MNFGIFLEMLFLFAYVHGGLHQKLLLRYLFDPNRPDAHNPMERPSENDSEQLNVSVKFFLNQVMDVDEKNQVLTTIIWMDLSWHDYHFRWDPRAYGNITSLNLPYTAIWRPDILLYNCADEKFDRTFPTNTVMRYNGDVQWMPPGLFKSTCNIDISWFPFDEQNCVLKFGSWTYYGDLMDFRVQCMNESDPHCTDVGTVDLSEYSANGEFHLKSASVRRYAQRYECCDYDFIDIKMFIRLQRRALYYVFNLIVPCLIISGMSLMVFMLPPDAGEKISLGVTILLSLTMFLQLVADKLPQTSEAIPLIGIYFSCTMIMCSLSIVFTVLVLNYHHRSADETTVPFWIRKFVNTYLARMVFMQPPGKIIPDQNCNPLTEATQDFLKYNFTNLSPNLDSMKPLQTEISPSNASNCEYLQSNGEVVGVNTASRKLPANVINIDDEFRVSALPYQRSVTKESEVVGPNPRSAQKEDFRLLSPNSFDFEPTLDAFSPENLSDLTQSQHTSESSRHSRESPKPPRTLLSCYKTELENIVQELRFITSKLRDEEHGVLINLEWKFAARVVDRFCLIVFGLLNLLAAAIILLSAPNLVASFQS